MNDASIPSDLLRLAKEKKASTGEHHWVVKLFDFKSRTFKFEIWPAKRVSPLTVDKIVG